MVQTSVLEKAVKEAQKRGVLRSGSHSGIAVVSQGDPWKGTASICMCKVSAQLYSSIPLRLKSSNSPVESYPRVPLITS